MSKVFVVVRVPGGRLRILYGDYRAVATGTDDADLLRVLTQLGVAKPTAALKADLRKAVDHFLLREERSRVKFGPYRLFRIWRVDAKTIQVELNGGYAELKNAAGDPALKACLVHLGANDILFTDLKREFREFLQDEE